MEGLRFVALASEGFAGGSAGDLALVEPDRLRLAVLLRDLGDHAVGSFLARGVVHHDGRPSAARPFAMAAPIPFDAPVTMATLPLSFFISALPFGCGCRFDSSITIEVKDEIR